MTQIKADQAVDPLLSVSSVSSVSGKKKGFLRKCFAVRRILIYTAAQFARGVAYPYLKGAAT
jgi:hypothetical protein